MPGDRSWDGRSYNGTHMAHQVVLITGAKGGLGAHVTRAFLESRAQVIGTSRQIAAADFPLPNFTPMPADLTKAEEANQLAAAMTAEFQGISVMAHVAGGFAVGAPIHEADDTTWDGMMNFTVRAAFPFLRAVLPPMRLEKRVRI